MARTGLTMEDYKSNIFLQLGSSVINVEVEDILSDIVDMSFNELKNYITDVETMTLPFSSVIDLSGKKVANVVYLMRSRTTTGPGGLQDAMYIYSRQSVSSSYSMRDYSRSILAKQNMSLLSTDLDFNHDKREEKLYIHVHQPHPTKITLVYTPEYEHVEEIIEPFWQNLLKRLSVAHAKEILGRIRGKYQLNSATYNLDSDQLLSEAQAELSDIRAYLNANTDILLPID